MKKFEQTKTSRFGVVSVVAMLLIILSFNMISVASLMSGGGEYIIVT